MTGQKTSRCCRYKHLLIALNMVSNIKLKINWQLNKEPDGLNANVWYLKMRKWTLKYLILLNIFVFSLTSSATFLFSINNFQIRSPYALPIFCEISPLFLSEKCDKKLWFMSSEMTKMLLLSWLLLFFSSSYSWFLLLKWIPPTLLSLLWAQDYLKLSIALAGVFKAFPFTNFFCNCCKYHT